MKHIILALVLGAFSLNANAALINYIFEGNLSLTTTNGDFYGLDGAHFVRTITMDTDAIAYDKNFTARFVDLRFAPIDDSWFFTNRPFGMDDAASGTNYGIGADSRNIQIRDRYEGSLVNSTSTERMWIWGGAVEADGFAPISGAPDLDSFNINWAFDHQFFSPSEENPLPTFDWTAAAISANIGGQINLGLNGSGTSYQIDNGWTLSVGNNGVVPIPPAFWLFGSALGLLQWMRRKAM